MIGFICFALCLILSSVAGAVEVCPNFLGESIAVESSPFRIASYSKEVGDPEAQRTFQTASAGSEYNDPNCKECNQMSGSYSLSIRSRASFGEGPVRRLISAIRERFSGRGGRLSLRGRCGSCG
jgi:hypothetical protein